MIWVSRVEWVTHWTCIIHAHCSLYSCFLFIYRTNSTYLLFTQNFFHLWPRRTTARTKHSGIKCTVGIHSCESVGTRDIKLALRSRNIMTNNWVNNLDTVAYMTTTNILSSANLKTLASYRTLTSERQLTLHESSRNEEHLWSTVSSFVITVFIHSFISITTVDYSE